MSKATARRASPATARAIYVYAVVQASRPPALSRLPAGLPGALPPRALACGEGIFAVVADAPLSQYAGPIIEAHLRDLDWVGARALGHEAVVEALAGKLPTVPMKLFTLFTDDARACSELSRDRARLLRVFARIAGAAEFGVRLSFDELAARRAAKDQARAEASDQSGTAFLLQKKKQKDLAKLLLHRAQGDADALHDRLAAVARASRRRPPGKPEIGARILLEAAFLVADPARKGFLKELALRQRALEAAGYTVKLSGPWPAYNFVAEGP
jgi:hypothetical protein